MAVCLLCAVLGNSFLLTQECLKAAEAPVRGQSSPAGPTQQTGRALRWA